MFTNIGSKIKNAAKYTCYCNITVFIVLGIAAFCLSYSSIADGNEEVYTILGLALLIFGPLVAWIGSLFIYAFGELVENSSIIASSIDSVQSSKDTE